MQHTKIQNMTTSSIVDTTALRLKVGVKALYLNVKDFKGSIYIPFIILIKDII